MKSFLLGLALVAGFNFQAMAADGYSLSLVGAQAEESFSLESPQMRKEYRTESVPRTCFRRVSDGIRTQCRSYPQERCYEDHMSRRICRVEHVNRCENVIAYRDEAYTCFENQTVAYDVFSHNVRANVIVKVKGPASTANSCMVNFSLNGSTFNRNATCADYIVKAKETAEESREGSTVVQNRTIELTLVDARVITAPIKGGVREMRLDGQTVVVTTGDLTKNPNFTLKLYTERKKLFGDETLINRTLIPSEYSFEKTGEDSGIVKINLSKLIGGINSKKKHVIRVEVSVAADTAGAINTSLPSLSDSASITVND